jgi:hypothetical protein
MADTPGFTPVQDSGGTPGFTPVSSDANSVSATPQTPVGPSGSGMMDQLSSAWDSAASDTGAYGLKPIHVLSEFWKGLKTLPSMMGTTAQPSYLSGSGTLSGPVSAEANTSVAKTRTNMQKAKDTFALGGPHAMLEGIGRTAAAVLTPIDGGVTTDLGEQAGSGDIGGAAARGAGVYAGAKVTQHSPEDIQRAHEFMQVATDPVVRQTFKELSDAGSQHAAIMQGKVRTVNDLVRKPASLLQDAVMGENGEVGQHANAVLAADEADMQSKGSQTGMADTTAAVHAARETLKQNMGTEFGSGPIEGLLQRAVGPMSLRNLKALRTQVGKVAGSMYRSGGRGEAAALYSLYDGLTDAGNARAGELGSQAASSWNHYSDVTASYKEMEKGLLGDMLDPASHTTDTAKAKLLSDVVNNPSGLKEITNSMKKYGVDPAPLDKAVGIGRSLNSASEKTGNLVMGKLRAIIMRPLAVGVPAVGGGMAASAAGLSGGLASFVIPIAIAYHINGILDRVQLAKVLADVKKNTIDTSVTGELPDRQAPPPPPSAAPQAPPSSSGGGGTPRPQPSGYSPNPAATVPVERRSSPASSGYFGPERRTVTPQIGTPGERGIKLAKTPGEELAEQVRQARAGKPSGITEADAQQQLKKDPQTWAKYKQLRESGEGKAADVMLIKAKRELEGARK